MYLAEPKLCSRDGVQPSHYCKRTVNNMPKQKTHKGMQKRFKITASGKAKHRKANRGHILGKKSGDRKRGLRGDGVITGTVAKKIAAALRPGL